jgi:3-deoxy-manno-octulosonate cytidylyltransferase (CMP-KDO synthetase)
MPSSAEKMEKIVELLELEQIVKREKERGKKIVFTNGCFDIMHAGHIKCLEEAKNEGDILIVGLNSDASVRELKGEGRPIMRQEDRARVLAALQSVDYVIIFEELEPTSLIKRIAPHVLVKGADYREEEVKGAEYAERVKLVHLLEGRSTTQIISSIRRGAAVGIIPARMSSSRFHGKVLAKIAGKPMIQHVYERAKACKDLQQVYIATEDEKIKEVAEHFGAKVFLTKIGYRSGTERIADILEEVDAQIILNIQADEPLLTPQMLSALVEGIGDEQVCTLRYRIESKEQIYDEDVVKVVCDKRGYAIYFSRLPIPYNGVHYKHIGIYAYKRDALKLFPSLPKGELEEAERLEQLRFLENGIKVKVVDSPTDTISVDKEEDLKEVERRME